MCLIASSLVVVFFFQAEDGIRDLVRSRGLGDVYKRQCETSVPRMPEAVARDRQPAKDPFLPSQHSGLRLLSLIHI